MERIADLLLGRPRLFVGLLIVLLVAATGVLVQRGIVFDYSLENFLPADDPTIQTWRDFADRYEPDDLIIVVGTDVDNVFDGETLGLIRTWTEALAAIDGVEEVISPINYASLRAEGGSISVQPIIGSKFTAHPDSLAAYRAAMLADEGAVGFVINPEANAVALFVKVDPELNNYDARQIILGHIYYVLETRGGQYEFHYSGFPYIRNAYVNLLRLETVRYVFLSSLVVLLALLWLFRSVRGVVLPLVTVYLGVAVTVAIQMLFRAPIDVLSSTIAAIILVVGVADSIHLLVKYFNGLSEGLSKREAVRKMVVRLGAATFMTSLTTAIGFGTLATSAVVPMKRFGLFTAVGVLITFVISLVLITVVLLWTPEPKTKQIERLGRGRLDGWLRRLDGFVERRARAIVFAAFALTAVSVVAATQLRINTYINDEMGPKTDVYQHLVWFESRLTTPWQFEVLLTGEPDTFKDPARLHQAEAVANYLEARPEIRRVVTVTDLLARLNQALHGDSTIYHRIPDEPDLAAQQLFLLELTDPDLLHRFVDFDYGEVRVAALMNDIGSARMKEFRADLDTFLAETLDDDLSTTQSGTITLAASLSDYLVESLLLSIALAFLFISFLMAALFRSAKLVLISLIPNVIPLIMVAGVMGVFGIDVSPGTAVIFSIAFGIAVDDTIHMLARLRQEMAAGLNLRDAIRMSILGTGKAVILTSLVLLGGFGALMTSRFEGTANLGALVSLTVVLALLADLLLLPALLHVMKPKLTRKT